MGAPAAFLSIPFFLEVGLALAREPAAPGNKNLITIWLLVIILLMLGYAIFGERGVIRIVQAKKQQQQLEQKDLREEIDRLKHDKDYWEQLARKNLGMVREGELIYHLPPKDKE